MKKISTLFKKDPNDLGLVINDINLENQWVFDGLGKPTRKYDGSACAIIDSRLYKRYDVKRGREIPEGAIPCQGADEITGHHPHWVLCDRSNPADRYFFEAFDRENSFIDGTYELIGPKVQGNPEKSEAHILVKHGDHELVGLSYPLTYDGIKNYLSQVDIEGIVFHHIHDERMCKIRKSDFGIKR